MLGQSNDGLDVDTAESTTTLNVRLYNALFMVMHETSRELNMSLVVLSAFWILDLLFTLMFALGPGPALPWSDSAPGTSLCVKHSGSCFSHVDLGSSLWQGLHTRVLYVLCVLSVAFELFFS